jgi:peptidoglycan hydrolase-like protein with peptidoglycan-binding domain
MGQEGNWIKVHYADKVGYVHKKYATAMAFMSVGEDIKAVQTRLKALRYYTGAIDGKCGPLTAKAIVAYQIAKKLEVDGICGPKTWASLFA